jgi:hypothetical protein
MTRGRWLLATGIVFAVMVVTVLIVVYLNRPVEDIGVSRFYAS